MVGYCGVIIYGVVDGDMSTEAKFYNNDNAGDYSGDLDKVDSDSIKGHILISGEARVSKLLRMIQK